MAAGRKQAMMGSSAAAAALVALLLVAAASGAAGLCGIDMQAAVAACQSYCNKGSTEAAPSQDCCDKVRSARWRCLCSLRSNLPSYIDGDRVTQIPSKCKFDNAPTSC
ncbi:hypothetical protein GQ55_5G044400 [Panicum hallii var. hallii]|uniref:Bifunctional inhibitor/plant lipid transfer protein/seed storage helical domain-containing protein n=1 Tax=Panicum hallii var. hallii TaxID=1504633 RepID=A0A2T7DCK6_9POAL|nr:hypothetical protein GQ55_5G044400 [Panicum hallii var. hallii]